MSKDIAILKNKEEVYDSVRSHVVEAQRKIYKFAIHCEAN